MDIFLIMTNYGARMAKKHKQIPIGNSDFRKIMDRGQYYVDKTLFIKEILDSGAEITLITRPRRFGKTCNLSMLRYFFETNVPQPPSSVLKAKAPQDHKNLFQNLAIAEQGDEYMQHQGKYPVVFLSLKGAKANCWQECYKKLEMLISDLYSEHDYLYKSNVLNQQDKEIYQAILQLRAEKRFYENSLKNLIKYLNQYYRKEVIVLIDEYDTPVHEAFKNGFFQEIIDFLRSFLGEGLKDNAMIYKAVITGILRVTKENIFSDLNNPDIVTLLSDKYADKFGFTEAEVIQFLNDYQLEDRFAEVKRWYDGYAIGNESDLYNPWSIINFIDKHSEGFQPYWLNTSRNTLVNHLLARSSQTVKNELENLLENKPIQKKINSYITFSELERSSDALWSFLFFTGYLKVIDKVLPEKQGDEMEYLLNIPNLEVRSIYRKFVSEWFTDTIGDVNISLLEKAILSGDHEVFEDILQDFVLKYISFYDVPVNDSERVYHAFVLGLLIHGKTHRVNSNQESGYGRYDIILIPNDISTPGAILEFKRTRKKSNETLEKACHAALKQIDERKYETELLKLGVTTIYKYGVAFEGKKVLVKKAE